MPTFDPQLLDKYAELAIKVGVNVQPGQSLQIGSTAFGAPGIPIDCAPLVRVLTKHAYLAGAKNVDVIWEDLELIRLRLQHGPPEALEEFPMWRLHASVAHMEAGDAVIGIYAMDPDFFAAEDSAKFEKLRSVALEKTAPASAHINKGSINWLIMSASVPGWASKVFPDVSPEEAERRLWDVLFEICRVKTNDPVSAWQRHIEDLEARADYLNVRMFRALHVRAPGTGLHVGLPAEHRWHSARLQAKNGIAAVVNLPTEEIFTLPHKDQVEGTVAAAKPLVVPQGVIENLTLTFSNGKVTQATATSGQEVLDAILGTDEGARSLGEVALVPHSSPISQTGLLFYNGLIDENASCHMALGSAYRTSLVGGDGMSEEEFAAAGGNHSQTHEDFMIGSDKMEIDGITQAGEVEPIMRSGEWAFE